MPEKTMKIAGDCVRIFTSIIDPTIVGWNCKPLNRRVARSGSSCVNPCCFMKFITADRAMSASFCQQDKLALLAPSRLRRLRRGAKAGIVLPLPIAEIRHAPDLLPHTPRRRTRLPSGTAARHHRRGQTSDRRRQRDLGSTDRRRPRGLARPVLPSERGDPAPEHAGGPRARVDPRVLRGAEYHVQPAPRAHGPHRLGVGERCDGRRPGTLAVRLACRRQTAARRSGRGFGQVHRALGERGRALAHGAGHLELGCPPTDAAEVKPRVSARTRTPTRSLPVRTIRLLPIALLTFSACVTGERPQQAAARMTAEAAAARIAILAANKQWMAAIAAGRADSLVLVYASTARMMGAGTPTSVGREAIGREFGEMFKIGAWKIQLHTDSVFANGPLVLETGTWTSTFKAGPHAPPIPATDKGKYMVRWTSENGRWLIADDIYNSDVMPTPAPPPARAKAKRRR